MRALKVSDEAPIMRLLQECGDQERRCEDVVLPELFWVVELL